MLNMPTGLQKHCSVAHMEPTQNLWKIYEPNLWPDMLPKFWPDFSPEIECTVLHRPTCPEQPRRNHGGKKQIQEIRKSFVFPSGIALCCPILMCPALESA